MRDKQEYKRIWKKHHGTIPYGYHIHHIDGNPTNNKINNLLCLSPQIHAMFHKDLYEKLGDKKYAIAFNLLPQEQRLSRWEVSLESREKGTSASIPLC